MRAFPIGIRMDKLKFQRTASLSRKEGESSSEFSDDGLLLNSAADDRQSRAFFVEIGFRSYFIADQRIEGRSGRSGKKNSENS